MATHQYSLSVLSQVQLHPLGSGAEALEVVLRAALAHMVLHQPWEAALPFLSTEAIKAKRGHAVMPGLRTHIILGS